MVRETYKILINRPEHISQEDMAAYIVDAVSKWKEGIIQGHFLKKVNLGVLVLSEAPQPLRPKEARNWGQVVVEHLTKFKE